MRKTSQSSRPRRAQHPRALPSLCGQSHVGNPGATKCCACDWAQLTKVCRTRGKLATRVGYFGVKSATEYSRCAPNLLKLVAWPQLWSPPPAVVLRSSPRVHTSHLRRVGISLHALKYLKNKAVKCNKYANACAYHSAAHKPNVLAPWGPTHLGPPPRRTLRPLSPRGTSRDRHRRSPCTCCAAARARRCHCRRSPCTCCAAARARRSRRRRSPCTCCAPRVQSL